MNEDFKNLTSVWEKTQKKSQENTSLPKIKFDEITSTIFSTGLFYYYIVDFYDMSLSNVSSPIKDIHGFEPKTVTFNDILSTIHPDDIPFVSKVETTIADFFYNKIGKEKILQYKMNYSFRSRLKSGEYGLLNHQAILLTLDANGGFGKSLNIHTDISHLSNENTYKYSLISIDNDLSYMNLSLEGAATASIEFTKREKEIIKLLANGFTNSIIAKTLHIAENTVKVHRKNILQKANCKNTPELIKQCIIQGLV